MPIHRNNGQRRRATGIDITSNVNFRMTTPEERAMFAAGGAVIPDQFEQRVASRLAVSLRDEAIWQYHAGRHRGVILWCADQTFRYVREAQWAKTLPPMGSSLDNLPLSKLRDYDPLNEALVMTRAEDSVKVHRIGDDGGWTLVWHVSSANPGPASHSENEPLPAIQTE